MNMTALEALVVRLTGDSSEYTRILDDAEDDTKEAIKVIEKATRLLEQEQNAALQEAARITAAVATPTEKYAQEVAKLQGHLQAGYITQETYNRAIKELYTELPNVKEAEAQVAKEQAEFNKRMQDGQRITQAALTPLERFEHEQKNLKNLLKEGHITQQTYNRTLDELTKTLPGVQRKLQAAEEAERELTHAKQRANAIVQGSLTPLERYAARLRELRELRGRELLSVRQYGDALRALDREFDFHGKRLKQIQDAYQSLGMGMQRVGMSMSIGVTAPLTAMAVTSERAFMRYEEGLHSLQAAASPTEEELKKIDAAAMQLSEDLKAKPTAIVSAFTELLKAGAPLEKVLGGAGKAAVQFAKVGEMEVGRAAVVLSDAMNVFGEEAGNAADILSSAADASSISIAQIAESFSMASAVAGNAEQSLLDTAAAIAVLGNYGLKGSDAGTSLKTMLLRLMAPADQATKVIEKYNLQVRNADGTMKPMIELIGELTSKLGDLEPAVKDNALLDLFGQDAIRAAQIMMKAGTEGFNKMTAAMKESNSVAEKYEIMMDGANGAWAEFTAALERAQIALGRSLSVPLAAILEKLVDTLDWLTDGWNKMHPSMQAIIIDLGIAAAVAGPLLIVMGKLTLAVRSLMMIKELSTVMQGLQASMSGVSSGMASLSSSSAMASLGIGGLIVGLELLVAKLIYDATPAAQALNDALDELAKHRLEGLKDLSTRQQGMLGEAMGINDAGKQLEALKQQMNDAQSEARSLNSALAMEEEKYNSGFFGFGGQYGNKWSDTHEETKATIEDLKKRIDQTRAYIDTLNAAMTEAEKKATTTEQKAVASLPVPKEKDLSAYAETIRDTMDKLTERAVTAGLGQSEAMVAAIAHKMAAGGIAKEEIDKALEDLRKQAKANDAAEKDLKEHEKLSNEVENLTKKYQDQIDEINKVGDASEIAALKAKGATKEQIDALVALEAEAKRLTAAKKAQEEIDSLNKKYMSGEEKFAARKDELNKLWDSGKLSVEAYAGELEHARKEFLKLQNTASNGIEGLAAGSLELELALDAFRAGQGPANVDNLPPDVAAVVADEANAIKGKDIKDQFIQQLPYFENQDHGNMILPLPLSPTEITGASEPQVVQLDDKTDFDAIEDLLGDIAANTEDSAKSDSVLSISAANLNSF